MVMDLKTLNTRSVSLTKLFNPSKVPLRNYEYPEFHKLTNEDYNKATHLDALSVYNNNLFWIPRFYYHYELSNRFIEGLNILKKRTDWDDIDSFALTQLCLTEAICDTTYKLKYGYSVERSTKSVFHGTIDLLLYNDIEEANYLPIIPVMFPSKGTDTITGLPFDHFSMTCPVCAGLWGLAYSKSSREEVRYVRAIQTNGLAWRFFEVQNSTIKKTQLFCGEKSEGEGLVQRTLEDKELWKRVIGMIRYSIGIKENIPEVSSGSEIKRIEEGIDMAVKYIAKKNYKDMFEVKAIEDIHIRGKLIANRSNN